MTINWADNSVLSGSGGGTFTHTYLKEGTYQPTLSGAGFLNGNPCSTPPTIFATVTVTPYTGSACKPPGVIAQLTSTPPGIFAPLSKTVSKRSAQCANTIQDTSTFYLAKLDVFYANNIPEVPNGWPLIGFCASQDGMADLTVGRLQGAPFLPPLETVFNMDLFVTAGYNIMVADGLPPPTPRFGYLGPFYDVQTTQGQGGKTLQRNISWGYVGLNEFPTAPFPRTLPLASDAETTSVASAT